MVVSPRLVLSNQEIYLGAHFQQQADRFALTLVDQAKTAFFWEAETDVTLATAGPPSGALGHLPLVLSSGMETMQEPEHGHVPQSREPCAQEAGDAHPASPSHPSAP